MALVLQTVLFPLDLLSLSAVLSWISYLTVIAFTSQKAQALQAIFLGQLTLCLYIASLIGQVSLVGFLLNIIVVPLFPFVVFISVLQLFPELLSKRLSDLCFYLSEAFLRTMAKLGEWVDSLAGLYFEITDLPWLRALCFLLGTVLLLRLFSSATKMKAS